MTVRHGECSDLGGIRIADDGKLSAIGFIVCAPVPPSRTRTNDFDVHVGITADPAVYPSIYLSHSRFAQPTLLHR